jgi:hypothetical protein
VALGTDIIQIAAMAEQAHLAHTYQQVAGMVQIETGVTQADTVA